LGRFLLLSVVLHGVAAALTVNIPAVPPTPEAEIINVSFLEEPALPENADFQYGRITDVPEPATKLETPEKAEALALFYARATPAKSRNAGRGTADKFGPALASVTKQDSTPSGISDVFPAQATPEARLPMSGDEIDQFALVNPGGVMETANEIIIPLNTRKSEYIKYFLAIREAVGGAWAYPEEAIKKGSGGKVIVRFTLKNSGELEEAKIISSSGSAALDDAAMESVKISAPYEPFPQGLTKERIHIVATFDYSPQYGSAH